MKQKLLSPMLRHVGVFVSVLGAFMFFADVGWPQSSWEKEWKQLQGGAKQEGKVVFGIFPSPELRQALEAAFKPRFGIDIELNLATSAKSVKRIVDENAGGVRFVDVIISTWDNLEHTLLPQGLVEPLESAWILPEVKDPKQWWGGHLWTDKAKRFAYAPMGYMQDNIWYNAGLVKPEEITQYDHLLAPKWKGKIALWDPREGAPECGEVVGQLALEQGGTGDLHQSGRPGDPPAQRGYEMDAGNRRQTGEGFPHVRGLQQVGESVRR